MAEFTIDHPEREYPNFSDMALWADLKPGCVLNFDCPENPDMRKALSLAAKQRIADGWLLDIKSEHCWTRVTVLGVPVLRMVSITDKIANMLRDQPDGLTMGVMVNRLRSEKRKEIEKAVIAMVEFGALKCLKGARSVRYALT